MYIYIYIYIYIYRVNPSSITSREMQTLSPGRSWAPPSTPGAPNVYHEPVKLSTEFPEQKLKDCQKNTKNCFTR